MNLFRLTKILHTFANYRVKDLIPNIVIWSYMGHTQYKIKSFIKINTSRYIAASI